MLPRCCSLASSHCPAEHDDLQFPRKNSRMRLIDIGCAVVESQFFLLAQPLSDKVPFAIVCLKTHKVRHRNVPPGCCWAPCGVAPNEGLALNRGTLGPTHFSGHTSLQKPRLARILTKLYDSQVLNFTALANWS